MIALLLDHLWQSSLCAGGAGLIALTLSRNSAHIRFWLWFAASLKFLLPFAALTALSAYALTPMLPPVAAPAVRAMEPLAKPFSAPTRMPVTTGRTERSVRPVLAARATPPHAVAVHTVAFAHTAAASRSGFPTLLPDLKSTLLALWAVGSLLLAGRWLVRWLRMRALLRDTIDAPVAAPIAVKFTNALLEPGLVGILTPVILLPQGIERLLAPAELKAVIAHEVCHWRRHDNLLAAIHMAVEALFWFFPLVWWLGARLNAERERACDEAVLAGGDDPRMYAEGILKVCRAYLQSPLACVAGVSGADLKKRIEAIMENRLILQLNAARKFALSACAAAALALPLALGLMASPVLQVQAKADPALFPAKIAQSIAAPAPASKIVSTALPADRPGENIAAAPPTTGARAMPAATSHLLATEKPASPLVALNDVPITPARAALDTIPASLIAANDRASTPQTVTASCAAPALLNSLPMEPVPGSDTMTVPATIDGQPAKLLVGIADTTQLWKTEADKLDLPVREGRRSMDGGGRFSEDVGRVESLVLGSMNTGNFDTQIASDPDFANAGSDGVLGTDMMLQYDIDLDFAHRRLNYFSPEQCQGAGIYWAPGKIATVKMAAYGDVVYVPITLDGHTIIAALDTTADKTFLNPQVADALFGLKADSLEAGTVRDSGALLKAGLHRFSNLNFGGLNFSNPEIAVPFDTRTEDTREFHALRTARNTYRLSDLLPDMVIGMDVLKQTHLYVSFKNQRVYVSPAGDGAALEAGPIARSWFNVWRWGYDTYLHPYHRPFFKL